MVHTSSARTVSWSPPTLRYWRGFLPSLSREVLVAAVALIFAGLYLFSRVSAIDASPRTRGET